MSETPLKCELSSRVEWDDHNFRLFLENANQYLGSPFRIEYFGQNLGEMITVLRKTSG
jgi:hypothetical protein